MNRVLLCIWAVTETATLVLLIRSGSHLHSIIGFLAFHAATILSTYTIYDRYVRKDSRLFELVRSKGFMLFMGAVTICPVIGPPVSLSIVFYLRHFSAVPARAEFFKEINRDVLLDLQKKLKNRTIPITEALLIRQLSRDDALRMLGVIDEMDWSATKSGILRYVIRLCPYQNILLMAIHMLKKKTDATLTEIAKTESDPDQSVDTLRTLATLYHEICYLDLCEPVMKQIYLEKACDYAMQALKIPAAGESDALVAVRYLLEAGRVQDAYDVYSAIRARGGYFIPKWLPYELELSVRRTDMATFDTQYLLVESIGGVYASEKIKKAARAWKKVLTSAWL